MRSIFVRKATLCLFFAGIGSGLAWGADSRQGLFLNGKDGAVPAPVLGATVELKVTGIIARTKITQIFKNVSREWVEGIYIFPLPADAAVDTLRMKVGNRTILGSILEKEEARQTYEAAKQQGVKASLVEQQRPDVFTTAVAHIGPGETVEVAVELQQVVRWEHGRFGLRLPMVVAPHPEAGTVPGGRRLRLPPVLRRGSAPINPFAFHADLNPGFPLAAVESPSHAITVAKGKQFRYAVDLEKGVAPADADLVLEWTPAVGREPRAVYYSEEVDGERYSLLMVMPPGGNAWTDSFAAAADVKGAGIDKLWARKKIEALTASLTEGGSPSEVRRGITELGLRHHLVTVYTSLVAVDDQATAPAGLQPITRVVPVNPPRDTAAVQPEAVEDVITVSAEPPLHYERRISTGATVTQAELAKIPTDRDPQGVVGGVPGPAAPEEASAYYSYDVFEEMPPKLSDAEVKALCEEIGRTGWERLTLERALLAAPSQADALRKAHAAGLLRGFVAVMLHGKGCTEPPQDVQAEAKEYERRFGAADP